MCLLAIKTTQGWSTPITYIVKSTKKQKRQIPEWDLPFWYLKTQIFWNYGELCFIADILIALFILGWIYYFKTIFVSFNGHSLQCKSQFWIAAVCKQMPYSGHWKFRRVGGISDDFFSSIKSMNVGFLIILAPIIGLNWFFWFLQPGQPCWLNLLCLCLLLLYGQY